MIGVFRTLAVVGVLLVLGLLWLSPPSESRIARHALPKLLDTWLSNWEENTLIPFGESRIASGYETHRQLPDPSPAQRQLLAKDPGKGQSWERQRKITTALDGYPAVFGLPKISGFGNALKDKEKELFTQSLNDWAASVPTLHLAPVGHELEIRYEAARRELVVDALNDYPSTFDGKGPRLAVPIARYPLPSALSLTPPFLVLLLALLTGKTILSLFAGVLFGAMLSQGVLGGFQHLLSVYVLERALLDSFRLEILAFVLLLSAAIGLMTRSGGLEALVELIKRLAKTARSSQFATWLMGLLVFFDDYANTIVVGSTMRPLTDRLRVSREKLAYIVDSTAAPIAGLVPLSTWAAYEISQFAGQLPSVKDANGNPMQEAQGFSVFLQTMPFRFYCFLTLFFVLMTVLMRREFGPMLEAERRAHREGKVIADDAKPLASKRLTGAQPKEGSPRLARHAIVPIVSLVAVSIAMIFYTGWPEQQVAGGFFDFLRSVFENANSALAILIGSASAMILAAVLPMVDRVCSPLETMKTAGSSVFALSFAVLILILAWCIGFVCEDLGTKFFLVALSEGQVAPALLPTLLFLISCLIAFSTGSSWTTMAILLPNVVLLSHSLGSSCEIGGMTLMLLSIGAVLEGSIFGDHCSPVSDTTVLSSVASASDHLHHVRTQAPYALLVMLVSILFGYLPVAFLSPSAWPLSMLLGAGALVLFLLIFGRRPGAAESRG
ncbi:MAG: sodium:proton antiporter [Planctomycetota bacterium]|nr:MAG: sodium:proton antiporter [Planctomycetota bacterium]